MRVNDKLEKKTAGIFWIMMDLCHDGNNEEGRGK